MKENIFNYFNNNNFDIENEVNIIRVKNMYTKIEDMKKDFSLKINEKHLEKLKIESVLKNLENRYKKYGRETKEYYFE